MRERTADQAENPQRVSAASELSSSVPAPAKEHPPFLCESCGPDKPADQVFQCTLCALNYCVNHLAPMAHYCFGALGKSQSIGVSS